jgi:hypothetical protein
MPNVALGGSDFFGATEEWLSNHGGDSAIEYWMAHLEGIESIPIPTPNTTTGNTKPFFEIREFECGRNIVDPIKELARKHSATPFIVLMAIQCIELRDMFSLSDFAMTGILSNRDARPLFNVIGYLSDRLFYRIDVPGSAGLSEVIVKLLDERRRSWRFRYCPSDLIKQRLASAGRPISAPSFNFTPLGPGGTVGSSTDARLAGPFKPPAAQSATPPAPDMPYRLEVRETISGWRFKFWASRPDMVEAADRLRDALQRFSA